MPSEDIIFILKNEKKLEKKYSGKYVAVWKKKVVAAGKTISEVYHVVKESKFKNPLITYIPKKGEEALLI